MQDPGLEGKELSLPRGKKNHNQTQTHTHTPRVHLYICSIDINYIVTERGSPFQNTVATQSLWALGKWICLWKLLQEPQIIPA